MQFRMAPAAKPNPRPSFLMRKASAQVTGRINVIRGLDLKIHAGELVVICGRNGAGKSTLLNALVGRPRMSGGEEVDGAAN